MPERAHADFVVSFVESLTAPSLPIGATAPRPDETARRFAVYRNNVAHGLTRALATRFPVVERLVGPAFFAAMAAEFLHSQPPRSPMIHMWGGSFPPFLETFPPVAHLAYLADVARVELLRGEAYYAADARPLGAPGELAGITLHPSVRLLCSAHPVASIWAANQPASLSPRVTATGPQNVLILRRPDGEVPVLLLDPQAAAFVAAMLAGVSLVEAASHATAAATDDPAGFLARIFSLLTRHGGLTEKVTP